MAPNSKFLEEMYLEKEEIYEEVRLVFPGEFNPSEETDMDSESTYEDSESGGVFSEDSIPDGYPEETDEFDNTKFLKDLENGAKEFNHGAVQYTNNGVFLTKITNKAFKFNIEFVASKSEYFKYFIGKRESMEQQFFGRLEELNGLPVFHIDENPFVLDKILKYIYDDKRCYKFDDYKLATRVMFAAQVYGMEDYKLSSKYFLAPPEIYGLTKYGLEIERILMNFNGISVLEKDMAPDNKLAIKILEIMETKTLNWIDFPRTESELKAMLYAALPCENPLELIQYPLTYYIQRENHMLHWGTYPLEDIAELIPWEKIEDLDKIKWKSTMYPMITEETWAKIKSFHQRVKDIRRNKRECNCKKCNIFINCKYSKMPERDGNVRAMLEAGAETHPNDALLLAVDYFVADNLRNKEETIIEELIEDFFPKGMNFDGDTIKKETWAKIHAKTDKIYTEAFEKNC